VVLGLSYFHGHCPFTHVNIPFILVAYALIFTSLSVELEATPLPGPCFAIFPGLNLTFAAPVEDGSLFAPVAQLVIPIAPHDTASPSCAPLDAPQHISKLILEPASSPSPSIAAGRETSTESEILLVASPATGLALLHRDTLEIVFFKLGDALEVGGAARGEGGVARAEAGGGFGVRNGGVCEEGGEGGWNGGAFFAELGFGFGGVGDGGDARGPVDSVGGWGVVFFSAWFCSVGRIDEILGVGAE